MTYTYRCTNGHVFDVEKGMMDPHPTECVECKAPVRRVFNPLGVIFLCSGFNQTDKALDKPVPGYDYDEYDAEYGG